MSSLPKFQRKPHEYAERYIRSVLTGHQSDQSALYHLEEQPEGYFRAVFAPSYFTMSEGQTEPSKSQWNSLKKKIKRHHPASFVLKDYGKTQTPEGEHAYFIQFGFLEDNRRK